MSRPLRIEYPGAVYHVQNIGNRNEAIFLDDKDREVFLNTLKQAAKSCRWKVYAYALMDNHYHILFKTLEPNLVEGMKWLQTTYSMRFNKRHGLQGHLFAGRYKSMLVEASNSHYFSTLADYIHLNPARAGLVRTHNFISTSKWTSLSSWISDKKERPGWIHPEKGLKAMGCDDTEEGHSKYLDHLIGRFETECIDEQSLLPVGHVGNNTVQRGWCYGSTKFRKNIIASLSKTSTRKSGNYSENIPEMAQFKAEEIVAKGLKKFGMDEESLFHTPFSHQPKLFIALAIRQHTLLPYAWITQRLNMGTPRSLGTLLFRAKQLTVQDEKIKNWIDDAVRH